MLILDNKTVIHVEHIPSYQIKRYKLPISADHNSIVFGLSIEQEKILMAWNPNCRDNYVFREYVMVQFKLKYDYFQRLHDALNSIPQCIIDRLLPVPHHQLSASTDAGADSILNDYSRSPPYKNLRLDRTCQLQALDLILSTKSKYPLLVAGPFGTGKTRLLARAAFEILKNRKNTVLICAHHQASVDTFIEYFSSMRRDKQRPWYPDFIRVAPSSHHSKIKNANPDCFCTVTEANRKQCRLVVTTSGLAPFLWKYKNGYFTHILIDEGAQTREPETVSPLSLANENTSIIIAGDHNQVLLLLVYA